MYLCEKQMIIKYRYLLDIISLSIPFPVQNRSSSAQNVNNSVEIGIVQFKMGIVQFKMEKLL